jgi:hypothetical protein
MANPVNGAVGIVNIGSVPVVVNKVRTYSFTSSRDSTEQGPWIGDSNKVTTIGGKLGEISLEGDIPIGGDPGIQDIVDAYENGTTDPLDVTTEDGYKIAFTAPSYTELKIEGDAAETQTWSVTLSGAYTISQDT